MNHINTFQTEQAFIETVVREIHSRILQKTKQGKIFRLALSGGSTPGPIYRRLAELDITWEQLEIYLVDERYVPFKDPHSNYRMIRETLLDHVRPKKVVYFETSLAIEECLNEYESQLDPTQKEFFDLILLGMGTDGHTASLFPSSAALEEKARWVAHTTTDQFDVRDRLTLTFPALKSSHEQMFLLKGNEKEETLQEAIQQKLPAAVVLEKKSTQVFLLKS